MRSNDSATRPGVPGSRRWTEPGQNSSRGGGRGHLEVTTSTPHPIGVASEHPTSRRQRMATIDDVKTWRGEQAHGRDGEKLGTIADIYLDRDTREPEWAAI